MTDDYQQFVLRKSQHGTGSGFEPLWLPDSMYPFQRDMTEWSIRQGRGAIFADCGLGKTLMQLVWADNVVRKTNRPVLVATPIAVGRQTKSEADKFGIEAETTRGGKMTDEAKVWITNYEQLHHYDPSRFAGFVGDESSCIKDAKTARKATVVEWSRCLDYRLLCTATAAPNDVWELGTSSEALGHLGFRDMITAYFKQETTKDRLGWGRTKYRFRGHAEDPFWAWVCSWARSIRRPSDIGGDDTPFQLPQLNESEHVIQARTMRPGQLFEMAARNMQEEREERRRTIPERCEAAAAMAEESDRPMVLWCNLNTEGDRLASIVPGSEQVSGSTPDERKEELFAAFTDGQLKRLITKAKIGAWGLNWQHCSDTVVFPSHSFEQYYQLVRRFYRFGQTNDVSVRVIISEGEAGILDNLKRKQRQADRMFTKIVKHMGDAIRLSKADVFTEREELPKWLMNSK